jgi:hypothetical protein
MRIAMIAAAVFVLTTSSTRAGDYRLESGMPACLTEEAFDEMTEALVARNVEWAMKIPGCIFLKDGLEADIKDAGFAVSEVWVHPPGGGRPVAMFVNTETLKRK